MDSTQHFGGEGMKDRYRFRVAHIKGQLWRPAWQLSAGARARQRRYLARSSFAKKRWQHRRETAGQYRYWRGLFTVKEFAK